MLDELHPHDPRAQRSRRDLRRVHVAMRSRSILMRAIERMRIDAPRRLIELGAGDGTLLLGVARAAQPRWTRVELTLLDLHALMTEETREKYREFGWNATVVRTDIRAWAEAPVSAHYDLCLANLFLHHFPDAVLKSLLPAIARRTQAIVACEPRRDLASRLASRSVGILGANAVTREDAVKSVAAGFRGKELSAIWKLAAAEWHMEEYRAFPFTHCFAASRKDAQ